MKRWTLLFSLLSLFGCALDSGSSFSGGSNQGPNGSNVVRLPFNEFYLSTSFGISISTIPNPYYFNTWAVQKPYTTADDLYNYYITSKNSDLVPSGCLRTYIKENDVVTANVKCALPRLGVSKPNDLSWAMALVYEVEIVATLSPLKVTSAKIKFNDYNQIIDFTSKAQISTTNVNGYDELIIGGGDYVVTTNDNFTLYIKCIFSERLN